MNHGNRDRKAKCPVLVPGFSRNFQAKFTSGVGCIEDQDQVANNDRENGMRDGRFFPDRALVIRRHPRSRQLCRLRARRTQILGWTGLSLRGA
jgi:hypothetical protein